MGKDLHGVSIQKALENHDDIKCYIIESDQICGNTSIHWSNCLDSKSNILSKEKEPINIQDLDLIWWRRYSYPQEIPYGIVDDSIIDLINNECREALLGAMSNEFSGIWINDPFATKRAENKLIQLKVAKETGFKVPKTIVSQDPKQIRSFCKTLNYNVVVKPIKGTLRRHTFTRLLAEEHLENDHSIRLAPAIFQEYISGCKHIRAHCFGDSVYASMLETDSLDWRENVVNIPFKIIDLDKKLKNLISLVIRNLGLRMGIIDLKLLNDTIPIWLEVNPQGEFLFIEGMTGLNLISTFSEFLYSELKKDNIVKKNRLL